MTSDGKLFTISGRLKAQASEGSFENKWRPEQRTASQCSQVGALALMTAS